MERRRLKRVAVTPEEIGLYEIHNARGRVKANGLKSWSRRMTVATALGMLRQ